MSFGGHFTFEFPNKEMNLHFSFSGTNLFKSTTWNRFKKDVWILDYINRGQQLVRINRAPSFTRFSRLIAVYAPGCEVEEFREKENQIDESFILFSCGGEVQKKLLKWTGVKGYFHVQDPNFIAGKILKEIAETISQKFNQYELFTYGLYCQLISLILGAEPCKKHLFHIRSEARADGLQNRVEKLIRSKIGDSLQIADLAKHLNMSKPTFARVYPKETGESPHQTVLRIKMEIAKKFLLNEHKSIKETAESLGFSSEFHFSHAFKRLEGLSPRNYVRMISKSS